MNNKIIILCFMIAATACKESSTVNRKPITPKPAVSELIDKESEDEVEPKIALDKETSDDLSFSYKKDASAEILELLKKYENLNLKKWDSSKILRFKENSDSDVTVFVSGSSSPAKILQEQHNLEANESIEFFFDKDLNLFLVIEKKFSENVAKPRLENHYYLRNYKILKKVVNNKYENNFSSKDIINDEQRLKSVCTKYIDLAVVEIMKSLN